MVGFSNRQIQITKSSDRMHRRFRKGFPNFTLLSALAVTSYIVHVFGKLGKELGNDLIGKNITFTCESCFMADTNMIDFPANLPAQFNRRKELKFIYIYVFF